MALPLLWAAAARGRPGTFKATAALLHAGIRPGFPAASWHTLEVTLTLTLFFWANLGRPKPVIHPGSLSQSAKGQK